MFPIDAKLPQVIIAFVSPFKPLFVRIQGQSNGSKKRKRIKGFVYTIV